MKTTAVRLYGAMDLRTETFELPEIGDDGVRLEVDAMIIVNQFIRISGIISSSQSQSCEIDLL